MSYVHRAAENAKKVQTLIYKIEALVYNNWCSFLWKLISWQCF